MPDDSASMVGSATGSSASWTRVKATGPVIEEVNESTMPVIEENKSEAGKVITGPAQEDPWAADDAPVFWCATAPPPVANPPVAPVPPSSQCSSSCHSGSSKFARRSQRDCSQSATEAPASPSSAEGRLWSSLGTSSALEESFELSAPCLPEADWVPRRRAIRDGLGQP